MISDPLFYRIWRCLNVRHSSCLTRNTHKFSLIAIFFRYNYFAELGNKLIPLHFEIKLKNNLLDPAKSVFTIFYFENQSSHVQKTHHYYFIFLKAVFHLLVGHCLPLLSLIYD